MNSNPPQTDGSPEMPELWNDKLKALQQPLEKGFVSILQVTISIWRIRILAILSGRQVKRVKSGLEIRIRNRVHGYID